MTNTHLQTCTDDELYAEIRHREALRIQIEDTAKRDALLNFKTSLISSFCSKGGKLQIRTTDGWITSDELPSKDTTCSIEFQVEGGEIHVSLCNVYNKGAVSPDDASFSVKFGFIEDGGRLYSFTEEFWIGATQNFEVRLAQEVARMYSKYTGASALVKFLNETGLYSKDS